MVGPRKTPDKRRLYLRKRYRDLADRRRRSLGERCCVCGSQRQLEVVRVDSADQGPGFAKLWSCSDRVWAREKARFHLVCRPCRFVQDGAGAGAAPRGMEDRQEGRCT